ncbi:flagellar biosynthesis regulator FlaF [Methylocystis echinoides]|uniref:Flagellar FlaF family protein n=1 Tax=Methylocystis echinoides TaxID=29468 RepID=A0A9W6LQW6_9HYPH|nr:flagellar biosynthesis regulator FlaF [Methylocystis echinoides]GLI92000.1 flagellar FlaF family protein [Methylocystis echinoides]
MYHQRYVEMASDSSHSARTREKEALEKAIQKLAAAKSSGPLTPASFEATDYLRRLWSIFISDLCNEENGLPAELRASLISIGFWVRREADAIDRGASTNFDGLIDINRIIADGLA